MSQDALALGREHLARLIEAVQRCVYFLDATSARVPWPLDGETLRARQKDVDLFEVLAGYNERFAKLQDTLGASMRHAALLMGEPTTPFLKVLALFEKTGVLESVETWHAGRAARNLAAHDYEIDYASMAGHFNALHGLQPMLVVTAGRLVRACAEQLSIVAASDAFAPEFDRITATADTRSGG